MNLNRRSMEQKVIEKRNKQNLSKFVTLLNDYEEKLDGKVDDMVRYMMNYSKKVTENNQEQSLILPEITKKKVQKDPIERKYKSNHSKSLYENKTFSVGSKSGLSMRKTNNSYLFNAENKSITKDRSFLTPENGENMEEQINSLKKSVAETMKNPLKTVVVPEGRALGNKQFKKPKFAKRIIDVVPREQRLDPFSDKNVIKSGDLEDGVLSLIERGKIGKDVDIITAFEKGKNVLSAHPAIFHHGEERVTRNEPLERSNNQIVQPQYKQKITKKIVASGNFENGEVDAYSKILNTTSKMYAGADLNSDGRAANNWAITMPENQEGNNASLESNRVTGSQQFVDLEEKVYLKFLHYQVVESDQSFIKFKVKNYSILGEISMVLRQLQEFMKSISLEIAYVEARKVRQLSYLPRRLKDDEISAVIVSMKGHKKIPIKDIANIVKKKATAAELIKSLFQSIRPYRQFHLHLKQKKVQLKICNWLYNIKLRRDFKQKLAISREENLRKYGQIQEDFKSQYEEIVQHKHFEIHISNKSLYGKESYREILNTEITRIFNFQNPHTHIVIVLPEELSEETKSYYYKIMELEEIPNFRERVSFLNLNTSILLKSSRFSTSQKLYYNSGLIRELKNRIGGHPAYFRTSYPSEVDIHMSTYLGIPILSGNLYITQVLELRSKSFEIFTDINELKCLRINPGEVSPMKLSSLLINFCSNNKRYRNYVIKINRCYQSTGIGLLTYPFESLPEMYSNTAFVLNTPKNTKKSSQEEGGTTVQAVSNGAVSEFYRKLCKEGGIVQVFEENLTSVMIVGKVNANGTAEITATFDKLSYGFVNIGYFFPQMTIEQSHIEPIFASITKKLIQAEHFGGVEISLFIDKDYNIFLDKVQCYQTQVGSSLHYFKFLCDGNFNSKGQYITKIVETFETDDNKEEELVTLEPRNYCFIPYILHFGLSDKQVGSFFQLCRMGGISFDLENKFGSTFILLGSLKNSMGMITTARDRQTCRKLMLKSMAFIVKQNSHNNSTEFLLEKQKRMKERENILALQERLEDF